jgi:hypothetical protein
MSVRILVKLLVYLSRKKKKGRENLTALKQKRLRLLARSPELRFFLGDYIHHSPLRTAGRPAAKAAAALLA